MSGSWIACGIFGISALLGGCSGTRLNDVGDIHSDQSGHAGGASNDAPAGNDGSPGGNDGSLAGNDGSGAGASGSPGATERSTDLVGTWTGYVENFEFADGSDAVEFTITSEALTGTLVLGASAAPPPATDPDVPYPPDAPPKLSFTVSNPNTAPYPGFAYTIRNPSRSGPRLQLEVFANQLYESWCKIQTPYADDKNPGSFRCLPSWASITGKDCSQTDPNTHQSVTRSCTQVALCVYGQACSCTAEGCQAGDRDSIHFDLTITPDRADGSVSGLDGNTHDVHLSKSD